MATGNILAEGNTDKLKLIRISVNANNVPANSTITQTVTVPGVLPGDFVWVNRASNNAGFMIGGALVLSPDNVQLLFGNPTAAPVDPGAENFLFLVLRPDAVLTAF